MLRKDFWHCGHAMAGTNSGRSEQFQPRGRRRTLQSLTALGCYLVISLAFFGPPIAHDVFHTYIGQGKDPLSFMWHLVWWPYAVTHRLNPFLTRAVWAPMGDNLAWTTSVPGASLLAAPMTLIAGPVVAFNVLALLAPGLAAWSAYLLCHQVTGSFWPALTGGYLFGFSSYELGQQLEHLHLTLIFVIPLLAYLVILRIQNAIGPRAYVLLFGLALIFQFLFSIEVFFTVTIFGGMTILVACLVMPARARTVLWPLAGLTLCAYALATLVLSPYLYYTFAGGYPNLAIHDPELYSSDLLNFVVPTPITVGGNWFQNVTSHFPGNYAEEGAYLGLPLIVILCLFARARWKTAAAKLLLVMCALACLASLGPTLHIAGHPVFPRMERVMDAAPRE